MINDAVGLRVNMATGDPDTIILMSHVMSGPSVGGDLERVLINIFSDYYRYIYLVWGKDVPTSFSWRDEQGVSIPQVNLDNAIHESDMMITTLVAYQQYNRLMNLKADKLVQALPEARLITNLQIFFSIASETQVQLKSFEMPDEKVEELKRLSGLAEELNASLEVLSYQAFEESLRCAANY